MFGSGAYGVTAFGTLGISGGTSGQTAFAGKATLETDGMTTFAGKVNLEKFWAIALGAQDSKQYPGD